MARVDYQPFSTVEARDSAPDDLQHIDASPNAFGAQVAQGVGDVGQGIARAADFYGQVAGTNAVNNAITQATNVMHGDANKMVIGPDGQPTPDTGYFGLRGADAMSARQSTSQAIQQIITQNGNSLTPEARERYEATIRRYQAEWEGQIGSHADQQQYAWSVDTNNTTAQLAFSDLGRDPGNPDVYANVLDRVAGAYVKNAHLSGVSADGALFKAKQDVAVSQVRSLLNTDPLAAWNALKSHMDLIGALPGTYGLQQEAKAGALDNLVGTLSDPTAVAAARATGAVPSSAAGGAVSYQAWQAARTAQESGGRYDAVNADTGAMGKYQVMPETGKSLAAGLGLPWKPDLMTATGPEAQRYQDAIGDAAAKQAWAAAGSDPAKASVYYYGGQRTLDAYNRDPAAQFAANNPKTAAYVKAIAGRLGNAGDAAGDTGGTDDSVLTQARLKLQLAGFGPGEVERGVRQIQANIARDESEQIARVASTVGDSVSYLTNGGDPSKVSITPASVQASLPGAKGQALGHALQSAIDVASSMQRISTATPQQVQQILADHKPTGPDDYGQKAQAYNNLAQAADRRQMMLLGNGQNRGDPVAYVNQYHPELARGLNASINGSTPNGFDSYIGKTLATQAQLGVPPEMQAVLPNAMAQGIVHRLQTVSPQEAFKSLANLQTEAGSNFSYVYRDLVKAGMPSTFQAAMLAGSYSPQNGATMIAASQHDAELRGEGKSGLADQASKIMFSGKPITGLVDRALATDAGMSSLRQVYGVAGRAGLDSFNGIQQAVRNTALYLYMKGSVPDPATAASQAAKMVAGNYDFVPQGSHPPVQLPKGQTQAFQQATQFVLRQLHAGDVRPYPVETTQDGHTIARSENDRAGDAFHSAQHAYWVSVPGHDGKGAVQAFDPATGTPVIIKNGMPLLIPVAQLNAVAARNAAFSIYGLGAH
jgi:hypothetical protein